MSQSSLRRPQPAKLPVDVEAYAEMEFPQPANDAELYPSWQELLAFRAAMFSKPVEPP